MNPHDFDELRRAILEAAKVAYASVYWLPRGCDEWHAAWNGLWRTPIGAITPTPEDRDTATGEDWQYMGTSLHVGTDGLQYWQHEFRHRRHPVARQRLYARIGATTGWTPWEGGTDR